MYVDNNCGENNVSRHVPISDYRQPRLDSQLIESLEISPCGILTITCISPAVISLNCCQPVETCRCYRSLSPFIELLGLSSPCVNRVERSGRSVTHLMMWVLVSLLWKAPWCENRRAIGLVISVSEYWRRLRHVIERRERRGYCVLRMLFFALYCINPRSQYGPVFPCLISRTCLLSRSSCNQSCVTRMSKREYWRYDIYLERVEQAIYPTMSRIEFCERTRLNR